MTVKLKTSASALNEVTATIMWEKKVQYHESFMMDTTQDNSFEYKGKQYHVPPEGTLHYNPSFLNFPYKLGMFYEQHKTLATFFDWFGLRKRAVHEIGYLYQENQADPIDLSELNKQLLGDADGHDWALINNHLYNNTSIEGAMHDADMDLKGSQGLPTSLMLLIGIIIIAIVAAVVVVFVVMGQHPTAVSTIQHTPIPSIIPKPTTHPGGLPLK